MKLNLGCGRRPIPGYVNADIRSGEGVDCIFDAQETWPFPTASFEEVRAHAVFEHLPHWESALLEAARVLKPGGILDVLVPYGWRGIALPFHLRAFDERTFDLFTDPYRYRGSDLRWHVKDDIGTLERGDQGYYEKVAVEKRHHFPFAWHLAQRLGDWVYRIPLSRTGELRVTLRRNAMRWEEEATS